MLTCTGLAWSITTIISEKSGEQDVETRKI